MMAGAVDNPTEYELMCLYRARLWESLVPFCQEFEEVFRDEGQPARLPGDKYKRYKQKLVSEGRCPHCGKPCAPYVECEERRAYKRAKAKERTQVYKKSGRPGDKRFLPKRPEYDWRIVIAKGPNP